jgi:hypothetical protein
MRGLFSILAMPSVSALLGQSLNTDALRVLGRVALQPGLAVAHISVPHIGYVDWPALRFAGVRGVVFDKGAYDSLSCLSPDDCLLDCLLVRRWVEFSVMWLCVARAQTTP